MSEQHVLDNVKLHLLAPADTLLRERFRELMEQHHYLKTDILVGEQLRYVANNSRYLILPGPDCPNLASRVLAKLNAEAFERILIDWEIQRAGQVPEDDQIAIDGKAQRGSTPHVEDEQKAQLVSAQSQPSGRVLGTVAVENKSNEIPVARKLLEKLGPLDGKLLMLDALHPCQ